MTTTSSSKIARVVPRERSDAFIAGDTVSFQLPDGVVDLATIDLWFLFTITGGSVSQRTPPRDIETLIEHLWITVDGEEVQRITHYNQVFRTLFDVEQTYDDQRKRLASSWSGYVIGPPVNSGAYVFNNRPVCMTK